MSNCCTECFLDEYLKGLIKDEGALGECTFCGCNNVYIIDPEELQRYFYPLLVLYTEQVDLYPVEMLKECEGRFIWEILSDDWGVFDDRDSGKRIIEEMYPSHHDDTPWFLDSYVEREDVWYGVDQKVSDRLTKQWNEFCEEITYVNRFFPQKKTDLKLISEVLSYSKDVIAVDELLFRARLSPDGLRFPSKDIAAPPKEEAVEGRANPSWIPYLYLASDPNTAISEIRPQVHNTIAVGTFKVNKQIQVVDLRNPHIDTPFRWGDRLSFVLDIHHFLRMLGQSLSKPVDRKKSTKEYLPTQYLCEFIKSQGFDGVLYKSVLGSGYNLVLFSDAMVEWTVTKLYRVASTQVKIEEVFE